MTNTPAARTGTLLAASVVARLPLAMLGIALLVHIERLTGSFAAGGVVTAAYALSQGIGGPLLGRMVDRRGQRAVLLVTAWVASALLALIALAPAETPTSVLMAAAAGVGLATPPVGACLRACLPQLLSDPVRLRRAYALDATAVELTFVIGPPLALGVGALWSTSAALLACSLVMLGATWGYAAHPGCRSWRPQPTHGQAGALTSGRFVSLVAIMAAVGVLFGAVEVGAMASMAGHVGSGGSATVLGAWGLGSLLGGSVATWRGWSFGFRGLAALLTVLTLSHVGLAPVTGSLTAFTVVMFVAGSAIAPTYAAVYGLAEALAKSGAVTESFAWLSTAILAGSAAGSAIAGNAVDRSRPSTRSASPASRAPWRSCLPFWPAATSGPSRLWATPSTS